MTRLILRTMDMRLSIQNVSCLLLTSIFLISLTLNSNAAPRAVGEYDPKIHGPNNLSPIKNEFYFRSHSSDNVDENTISYDEDSTYADVLNDLGESVSIYDPSAYDPITNQYNTGYRPLPINTETFIRKMVYMIKPFGDTHANHPNGRQRFSSSHGVLNHDGGESVQNAPISIGYAYTIDTYSTNASKNEHLSTIY